MSLFSGLYVGTSGLQTAQNALNTVAHNLSNLDTPGYVRQQVSQSDLTYNRVSSSPTSNMQVGLGAYYSEVRHIRSELLDKSYREESGRQSFYEVSYGTFLEVENILGELDGAAFADATDDFWTALEELSKSPSDSVKISNLVHAGYDFVQNAASVYQSFIDYQNNLNTQIGDMVTSINEIGAQIASLNKQIQQIEAGSSEHANDLRDKRDYLLDELSSYVNISFKEELNTCVSVKINGTDFISDGVYNQVEVLVDEDTGFYTPYWKQNVIETMNAYTGEVSKDYAGAFLYDLTQEITTAAGTDVGGLKALLLARGDHYGVYSDLQTDTVTNQKLKSLEIAEGDYDEEAGLEYYNDYISQSIMMNTQAEFDQLVHAVVTMVNEVLMSAANPQTGYLCNDDGTPILMFEKLTGNNFTLVGQADVANDSSVIDWENDKYFKIYDEDGEFTGDYWVYTPEDQNDVTTLYSSTNTKVNQSLMQMPSLLGFVKQDGTVDYELANKFVDEFGKATIYLNPNATKTSSIQDYYVDFVSQIANSGSVYKNLYENQQLTVEQVEYERQGVVGVSSDEELDHMIMYQNAYNAASRYINVLCTMMDSLLSIAA